VLCVSSNTLWLLKTDNNTTVFGAISFPVFAVCVPADTNESGRYICNIHMQHTHTHRKSARSVSVMTSYGLGDQGSVPERVGVFSSTLYAKPALGPTQSPVQWVPGALSHGVKCGRGVMLTTRLLLVPRLRR
jgi:hypothetical protein